MRSTVLSYVSSKSLVTYHVLLTDWMCSIVKIMRYWVTEPNFKVDTNVLNAMKVFATSIMSSEPIERFAMGLHFAILERVWLWCFR